MSGSKITHAERGGLIVAVPVLFLDEQLPQLKDTELRIVLVIWRQTHVVSREAHRTWLTHSELCRRTGRSSEAVCAAIEHLVRMGLLEVRDESENVLATAAERRRVRGRHFYQVRETHQSNLAAGKAKTIEENKENNYSFRNSAPLVPEPNNMAYSKVEAREDRIQIEKERIRELLKSL